jgi:hypothetical protein
MAGITLEAIMLGTVGILLLMAIFLMAMIVAQLRAMRRQVEEARVQLGRMDWGALLMNGVRQLKEAVEALDHIDKRLQKLEAIEKVQLSHINVKAGS